MKRLLIVLFCLGCIITVNAQHGDEIPYIYYYSHVLNGIVIERADGTDSRIIGQGLVEEDPLWIEGVGWSPSGEWFAWRSLGASQYEGGTFSHGRGYVAHIDGQTHLEWMQYLGCVTEMWWHPSQNLLLVLSNISSDCTGSSSNQVSTYSLIDVDSQTRLATVSLHSISSFEYVPEIFWDEDRLFFYTSSPARTSSPYEREYSLVTLSFDGNVTIETITQEQIAGNPVTSNSFNASEDEHFFSWLANPDLERPPAPINNSSSIGGAVAASWSVNQEWLFVGYEFCSAGCSGVPHRVNIYNPETGHNREISSCGTHSACVDWLPENVSIDDLPIGQDYPVLPYPDSMTSEQSFFQNEQHYGWFSDVITHEIICEHGEDTAQVQLIETGETVFTMPTREFCVGYDEIPPVPVIFALSPDENYYALTDDSEFTALYHADTGAQIARFNFYGIRLRFSEDSSQLITSGRFAEATWDVQRLIEQYGVSY